MIKFCIVTTARSGSSYLTTSLAGCPTVLCHGEVFHPDVAQHFTPEYAAALDLGLRERNPLAFVDEVYDLKTDVSAAGFKMFRGHNDMAMSYVLKNPGIKKIVLQRENVLASYSSLLIAIKTRHWQNRLPKVEIPTEAALHLECAALLQLEQSEPVEAKITFDPLGFQAYWDWNCQTYDFYHGTIADAKGKWLDIDYLTLTRGDFSSIEHFLDLPRGHEWRTEIGKLNTGEILDRFYNQRDVIQFVRQWKIENWLRE